jgi:hypothetical protein
MVIWDCKMIFVIEGITPTLTLHISDVDMISFKLTNSPIGDKFGT